MTAYPGSNPISSPSCIDSSAFEHRSTEGKAVGTASHCVTVPAVLVSGGLFASLVDVAVREVVDMVYRRYQRKSECHKIMLATALRGLRDTMKGLTTERRTVSRLQRLKWHNVDMRLTHILHAGPILDLFHDGVVMPPLWADLVTSTIESDRRAAEFGDLPHNNSCLIQIHPALLHGVMQNPKALSVLCRCVLTFSGAFSILLGWV